MSDNKSDDGKPKVLRPTVVIPPSGPSEIRHEEHKQEKRARIRPELDIRKPSRGSARRPEDDREREAVRKRERRVSVAVRAVWFALLVFHGLRAFGYLKAGAP